MLSTADFFLASKWAAGLTVLLAIVAGLAFALNWGLKFRLVGATGFMGVLTAGLFTLSLVPFSHQIVPGAARYTVIYDAGGSQAVIAVAPTITPTELEATLQQAAISLYSYGRMAQDDTRLTIRARTIIHPKPGLSQVVYLGTVKRSLSQREDEQIELQIYQDNFSQLAQAVTSPAS